MPPKVLLTIGRYSILPLQYTRIEELATVMVELVTRGQPAISALPESLSKIIVEDVAGAENTVAAPIYVTDDVAYPESTMFVALKRTYRSRPTRLSNRTPQYLPPSCAVLRCAASRNIAPIAFRAIFGSCVR